MKLRNYQKETNAKIHEAWRSVNNVMAVLPTGAGKTVLFGHIIDTHPGACCAIAHRQELVSQISMALCKYGVEHRIIGPSNVIRTIIGLQQIEFGTTFYNPSSRVAVAGVDTLVKRAEQLGPWANQVTLWVQDEAHHVLKSNKWGQAASLFPNAKGLGVTATPVRADGRGLGRHADGLMDTMVVGPSMRELIDQGYLTDYRIFAPPSNLDLSNVTISATTGDYSKNKLTDAVRKSNVMGDVVDHYLRIAAGKLGITFATDVQTATEIAGKFNACGVPSEIVSAKTPDSLRASILRRFRRREVIQLVNVDLFGEGFDLPALEVVSMARPTQSYALYSQQFGRSLRIMDGKQDAIIIDHVGNVIRHGLPDAPRTWNLDRKERRSRDKKDDVIPVRACPQCTGVYERIHVACPYCGHVAQPEARSGPEFVDGDLCELDPAALAAMRGEIARIDQPADEVRRKMEFAGAPAYVAAGAAKQHRNRQEMQHALRESIAWWAACQRQLGRSDRESYRRFYHQFGIDVGTAQTLGRGEAEELAQRVNLNIGRLVNEYQRVV